MCREQNVKFLARFVISSMPTAFQIFSSIILSETLLGCSLCTFIVLFTPPPINVYEIYMFVPDQSLLSSRLSVCLLFTRITTDTKSISAATFSLILPWSLRTVPFSYRLISFRYKCILNTSTTLANNFILLPVCLFLIRILSSALFCNTFNFFLSSMWKTRFRSHKTSISLRSNYKYCKKLTIS